MNHNMETYSGSKSNIFRSEKMEIWVYFVVAGILFSAYMTIKTANEEREVEQKWIETEGDIFMERIKKERGKKLKKSNSE